ncbi:hypothetical protein LOD99_9837 [Oopsacas minuta]|uniref:Integrase zinc-binding domain-containing protein n=1 Tax=Oopsacas minuta TaxID=111878 RepID=A0AAV7KLE8_9METZ|nr:hypothetical protein LOD99_9837 [Oopsacas minuta]
MDAVLKMCHDNPVTGGRFSSNKTYQKIASRFYWKDVVKFPKIRNCNEFLLLIILKQMDNGKEITAP